MAEFIPSTAAELNDYVRFAKIEHCTYAVVWPSSR